MPTTSTARKILNDWLEANPYAPEEVRTEINRCVTHLANYYEHVKPPFEDIDTSIEPQQNPRWPYLIWTNDGAGSDYECKCLMESDPEQYEGLSENEIRRLAIEYNDSQLGDEVENLNTAKLDTNLDILVITRLGLWDGPHIKIETLRNIGLGYILKLGKEDTTTFYGDGKNIYVDRIHHDGTNTSLFMGIPYSWSYCIEKHMKYAPETTDLEEIAAFLNERTEGKLVSLWPLVAGVYGWDTVKTNGET